MCTIINGLEIDPSQDGETHINAYSASICSLGRMLSNFPYMPADTPDGKFDSLEGYYHYVKLSLSLDKLESPRPELREKIENLRTAYGSVAQRRGRNLRSEFIKLGIRVVDKPNDEFTHRFKYALINKIISNPELHSELMENRLPIVHYYTNSEGDVFYHKRFNWLSNLITNVELNLKGLI